MPSGQTHDRLTLGGLPVVVGATFGLTRSAPFTLLVSGGYLFSGLMFGPDLDIHSVQFRRWGLLRWLWLPYRKLFRHRSWWSHGPIVGTLVRLIYLGLWGLGLALIFWGAQTLIKDWPWPLQTGVDWLQASVYQFPLAWLAALVGLELGALSHIVSDWLGSAGQKRRRRSSQRQRRSRLQKQSNRRG